MTEKKTDKNFYLRKKFSTFNAKSCITNNLSIALSHKSF